MRNKLRYNATGDGTSRESLSRYLMERRQRGELSRKEADEILDTLDAMHSWSYDGLNRILSDVRRVKRGAA